MPLKSAVRKVESDYKEEEERNRTMKYRYPILKKCDFLADHGAVLKSCIK